MQVLVTNTKNTVTATVTKPVSVTCSGYVKKPNDVAVRRNGPRYPNRLTCPLLSALCFLLVFMYSCGTQKHYVRSEADIKNIKRVAVLPFENFSPDETAGEKMRRIIITALLSKNIDVVEPGEVTRLFRELKIKSIGSIKITEIQDIGKTLGVDAVMMGSVESFGMGRGISVTYPEVTVHLRLIELSSGNIIWSVRRTSGGPDFWTRHFGSEGPSLSEAAGKVAKEAIGTLF